MTRTTHFDISSLIITDNQIPTGIQRVERGLLEAAFRRDEIKFVVMGWPGTNIRLVPRNTVANLLARLSGDQSARPKRRKFEHLLDVFLLKYRFGLKETARELARIALGQNVKSGVAYQILKTVFRMLQWIALLTNHGYQTLKSLIWSNTAFNPDDIVLYSFDSGKHASQPNNDRSKRFHSAFIVYDLMPVARPDLSFPSITRMMTKMLDTAIKNESVIITISETVKNDVLEYQADSSSGVLKNIFAIKLGATRINSIGSTSPIQKLIGKKFVIFCSTFELKKRHDTLVEAWQDLIENYNADTIPLLVFVGQKSTGYDRLQHVLAANPKAREKVLLLHDVDDEQLLWAYKNAYLGLFASRYEGWGLGVSESMSLGLPVIHSPISALREAAQGIMPEPEDDTPDAWSKVLAPYLADESKVDALREKLSTRYRTGEPEDFAEGVFDCLERVKFE